MNYIPAHAAAVLAELDNVQQSGEKILRWNIIDITEKCAPARHKPEEPKVWRYIHKDMPLRQISPEEYEGLTADNQEQFELIEAYAGCATCPLLPVCKTRLAHRPDSDKGGLF